MLLLLLVVVVVVVAAAVDASLCATAPSIQWGVVGSQELRTASFNSGALGPPRPDLAYACVPPPGSAFGAADSVVSFQVGESGTYVLRTENATRASRYGDTVLVLADCAVVLACNDDDPQRSTYFSSITANLQADVQYLASVRMLDGSSPAVDFTLTLIGFGYGNGVGGPAASPSGPPTPASYVPPKYTPQASLVMLHNAPRVHGGSQLTTAGEPLTAYVIGLAIPAACMIVVFLAWLCWLPLCAKCCCAARMCCSKSVGLAFFLGFVVVSIVGWSIGLFGNVRTTEGFTVTLDGVSSVGRLARRALSASDQLVGNATQLLAITNNQLRTECHLPEANEVALSVQQMIDTIGTLFTSGVRTMTRNLDSGVGYVHTFSGWREIVVMVILIVLLVLVVVFAFVTTLQVLGDKVPLGPCGCFLSISSKCTVCCVFVFGLLLLTLVWVVVALLFVAATAGADLCAPSFDQSINNIVYEIGYGPPQTRADPSVNYCADSRYANDNASLGFMCYYQTCVGTNLFVDYVSSSLDRSRMVATPVDAFQASPGYASASDACRSAVEEFRTVHGRMDRVLNEPLQDVIACRSANTIYIQFFHNGLCNTLTDGLYYTYVGCLVGCVGLMLALSTYRVFEFGSGGGAGAGKQEKKGERKSNSSTTNNVATPQQQQEPTPAMVIPIQSSSSTATIPLALRQQQPARSDLDDRYAAGVIGEDEYVKAMIGTAEASTAGVETTGEKSSFAFIPTPQGHAVSVDEYVANVLAEDNRRVQQRNTLDGSVASGANVNNTTSNGHHSISEEEDLAHV